MILEKEGLPLLEMLLINTMSLFAMLNLVVVVVGLLSLRVTDCGKDSPMIQQSSSLTKFSRYRIDTWSVMSVDSGG